MAQEVVGLLRDAHADCRAASGSALARQLCVAVATELAGCIAKAHEAGSPCGTLLEAEGMLQGVLRHEQGIEYGEQGKEYGDAYALAWLELGRVLALGGRPAEAQEALREAKTAEGTSRGGKRRRGKSRGRQRHNPHAAGASSA